MNVQPYVRHSQACPKKADRYWKRCRCPKWLWISGDGKQRRVSAKTRSWERAEQTARDMLAGKRAAPARIRLADAVAQYLRDKEAQSVTLDYIKHLEAILERGLLPWCHSEGLLYFDQITLAALERYRQTWNSVNWGRLYRQSKIKDFFSYCVRHKMIEENPASLLSPIKLRKVPTGYFTREEMTRILDAAPSLYERNAYHDLTADYLKQRLRALILLLRWSGLRISDAVSLPRTRLSADGKLLLYMAKTGQPVYVPLPPDVAREIQALPGEEFFFWRKKGGQLIGAVKHFRKLLQAVFQKAGVKGHAHMFRDTFAVELLLAGVPIEQVSMLLGHTSVKTTEKHYSPWVRARQEQLESSVRKAWEA